MPIARTSDSVGLYYEEAGTGMPIVFVHEFAGDYRSWEMQMRHFARRYRCIAFNARGYPPSKVPEDPESYSQDRACEDILDVLDHLGINRAHVVGLSMGAFATLHFALKFPERARSAVVAGCGYGASPDVREAFQAEVEATARLFEEKGSAGAAGIYAEGPARQPFKVKDPRGWAEFAQQLAEHDAMGAALTMRGVQMHRPSLWDLAGPLNALRVPVLVMAGDEDEPSLEPSLFLKRTIPSAALVVLPKTGHTMNLEEPDAFNRIAQDFLSTVDLDRWMSRDLNTQSGSGILGMR